MLDRLISGAGAVTDGADRSVRALAGGSQRGFATTRPGSLLVAAVLLVLAGMLVVAGLEATDPSTPVTLGPADVAASTALGDRTYSTIHGALSSTYAEYFSDDNANGTEDEGEETARLVLLARRPRCPGRRHRPLDEAAGGALHVSRDRDPDRRTALSARGLRGIRRRSAAVPASRSNRRSSSTRPTASPERGRRSRPGRARCRGPALRSS